MPSLQFSQFWNLLTNPTHPYLLYFDSTTGTLQVGTWGNQITAANYQSKMLCFKFGGVVGMDFSAGAFSTSVIKFNPTLGITITGYGSTLNDSGVTPPNVPGYTTADWNAGCKDVSASTYHNLANVKAGKGDPCKLVGLTVAQIQAGAIDNGQFRLPTHVENVSMAGGLANDSGPTAGKFVFTANDNNATNPAIGTFPTPEPDVVLPAVGYRVYLNNGIVGNPGKYGHYWSSTPENSESYYTLGFINSLVRPSHLSAFTSSSVRCVPQS